jgi:hypothetical protein
MEVGVDVSAVPFDEIIDFRAQNRLSHFEYKRDLRAFVRDLSQIPATERVEEVELRRRELAERAIHLTSAARSTWKRSGKIAVRLLTTRFAPELDVVFNEVSKRGKSAAAAEGNFSYLFEAKRRWR